MRPWLTWTRRLPTVLWLVLLAAVLPAAGQSRYIPRYIEPRWFTFRLSEVSAGVYAEALYIESNIEGGGGSVSYNRYFVGPSLGLNGKGSIYHPNFISYTLLSEGAFGYSRDDYGNDAAGASEEFLYLGTVSFDMNVLGSRPYNGGAFVNYDHTYQDLDFYNRLLVESWSYGGRATWEEGPWMVRGFYSHREEDSASRYPIGTTGTTEEQRFNSREDTVTVGTAHRRERGQTSLDYNFNKYRRQDFGQTGDGTSQSLALSDTERLDEQGKYQLNGTVSYAVRDSNFDDSEEFVGTGGFSAEHTPNLSSYYDVGYNRFTQDDFKSDSINGQASVSHRLYESLTSGATVRGSSFENNDRFSEGYTHRYGGGVSESYVKRLSDEHRLRLDASLFLEHTDQANIGTVINERHTLLPTGEPGAPSPFSFVLNQPNVNVFSIVITDETDRPPAFVPGFDYFVEQFGTNRTVITWLRPPGPGTPTVVLVDYEAEPTPPGNYETLTQYYLIRLELWRDLIGLYARLGFSDNNAEEELRVQEYMNLAFGTDVRWRNIRAGAEYQIYDSTDSDYRTIRLYQSINFRPDEFSTLSLDFNQQWITYQDIERDEQDYRFIGRFHRRMSRRLSFAFDAGIAYRTGFGVDQFLATARPSIRYVIGRMTFDAGYDYQQEIFINNEDRMRHMLFLRVKRVW